MVTNTASRTEITKPIGGSEGYAAKATHYFSGVRDDLVSHLTIPPSGSVLEIGCGQGGTGAMALSQRKCKSYCAVELFEAAAVQASRRLSEVVVGNVETVKLPWPDASFDALIMSEVLEHLVDPAATLSRLLPLLKPGAIVLASSPNASHYEIILMLLRGEWIAADSGPMDRTHLRWFTPSSYQRLFENCGYQVDHVAAVAAHGWKAKAMLRLSFGALSHLVTRQIMLRGHVK